MLLSFSLNRAMISGKACKDFRVSMSSQDSTTLTPVRNKKYFVKDTENNYCRWDAGTQRFVSLGISSYTDLAELLDRMTD